MLKLCLYSENQRCIELKVLKMIKVLEYGHFTRLSEEFRIHEFTGLANTCKGLGTGAALVPLFRHGVTSYSIRESSNDLFGDHLTATNLRQL